MRNNELQAEILHLQEENEKLKARLKTLDDEVLTIEITSDEFERYKKYKQAFEEIRNIAKPIKENTCFGMYCGAIDWILNEINEVLNDRD